MWHALAVRKYWSGSHTKHRLLYHLVWIPKYRKRVLIGKVAVRLGDMLYEAAQVHGWWIHELSVRQDHVHLLLQAGPDQSVAEVMQIIKGGTGMQLRREFPELKEFVWGASLWGDGYFAESVGVAQEEMIRRYIKEQHGQSMPPGTKPRALARGE